MKIIKNFNQYNESKKEGTFLDKVKIFENFNIYSILEKNMSKKEQNTIIDYIVRYLSTTKKEKIDNNDFNILKKNLKKYFIYSEGGLEEVLNILSDKKSNIDNVINILEKYRKLYLQWLNDDEWRENIEDFAVEEDDAAWYNYRPLHDFIYGELKRSGGI